MYLVKSVVITMPDGSPFWGETDLVPDYRFGHENGQEMCRVKCWADSIVISLIIADLELVGVLT